MIKTTTSNPNQGCRMSMDTLEDSGGPIMYKGSKIYPEGPHEAKPTKGDHLCQLTPPTPYSMCIPYCPFTNHTKISAEIIQVCCQMSVAL